MLWSLSAGKHMLTRSWALIKHWNDPTTYYIDEKTVLNYIKMLPFDDVKTEKVKIYIQYY